MLSTSGNKSIDKNIRMCYNIENIVIGGIGMDKLKQLFPLSFKSRDVKALVISIVMYVVLSLICSVVCLVLGIIPFIGDFIAWGIGTVVGIYVLVGIILAILDYFKLLK